MAWSSAGQRADHDLLVGRHVELDLPPVRNEDLFLGRLVVPAHSPRFLDQDGAAFDGFPAEHASLVELGEVRGEIANAVVLLLKRRGNLISAGGLRARRSSDGCRKDQRQTGLDAHVFILWQGWLAQCSTRDRTPALKGGPTKERAYTATTSR